MVTGKIKGGVNELVELLNDNNARSWKLVYNEEKTNGDAIFISDDSVCREDEIARMLRVVGNMDISRCIVVMIPQRGNAKDVSNPIKYEFSTTARDAQLQQHPASNFGVVNGFPNNDYLSRSDVERMMKDTEEKLSLKWKVEQLEDSRKEFEREKREFEREKDGVFGTFVRLLKPVVNGLVNPSVNVAGIAGAGIEEESEMNDDKTDFEDGTTTEVVEDRETSDNEAELSDAKRLSDALKSWAKVDEDYINVICKLSEIVVSGKPIAGMPYSTIKGLLMSM
jgi:hypothetical protein